MATLNGARHLPDQLASLLGQGHRDWRLWVGDDGSTDGTRALLANFSLRHPDREIRLFEGPRRGSAANFLTLLTRADLPPGPVSFCDQDDVWLPGKLARAVDLLPVGDRPALYGAASILTDQALRPRGINRSTTLSASFSNSLTQNIFSGHTLCLNSAAVRLARAAGLPDDLAFHDWWLYQLVAGAGGDCVFDPQPVALYRQHGANVMGGGRGILPMLTRSRRVLGREFRRWSDAHRSALAQRSHLLTPEARRLLAEMQGAAPWGTARLQTFRRLGVRRTGQLGTLACWGAAAFGLA